MKKVLCILCALLCVFMVSGCKQKVVVLNTEQMMTDVLNKVKFDGEMTILDSQLLVNRYGISETNVSSSYVGTGACADEITIITVASTENVEDVFSKAGVYLSERLEDFADYKPEEVNKLENAIIRKHNQNIVVCVTNDYENAVKIIDEYLK